MTFLKMCGALLTVAVGVMIPQIAEAQLMGNLFNNPCCNTCGHQVCTCSTTRPVVETRLRQQNCLTFQERKRIACRTEPVCVTVPVTKVDCVTVDEGCYQMIWVPKPVTKAVPRTELHQRVSYRTVPFEVTDRVPVMTTRLVPEQTIRYVTEHRSVTSTAPVPLCPPPPCPPATVCPPAAACPPGGVGAPYGIPSVVPGGHGHVPFTRGGHFGLPPVGPPAGFGGPSPVAVPYSAMRGQSPDEPTFKTAELAPNPEYAETVPVTRPVSNTLQRNPSAAAVWRTPRPAGR